MISIRSVRCAPAKPELPERHFNVVWNRNRNRRTACLNLMIEKLWELKPWGLVRIEIVELYGRSFQWIVFFFGENLKWMGQGLDELFSYWKFIRQIAFYIYRYRLKALKLRSIDSATTVWLCWIFFAFIKVWNFVINDVKKLVFPYTNLNCNLESE